MFIINFTNIVNEDWQPLECNNKIDYSFVLFFIKFIFLNMGFPSNAYSHRILEEKLPPNNTK